MVRGRVTPLALVVSMQTGVDRSLRPECVSLNEPQVGIEGTEHLPQGGEMAGKHARAKQAAETAHPYGLGGPQVRRHTAGYKAPNRRCSQKGHGIETHDAATLILSDNGLQRIFPLHFGERRTISEGYLPSCSLM
jgi:hypothetical protein